MLRRSYQRVVSYIALVAVVFASVAPTISHAIEAKKGNPSFFQEVCTTQGVTQVSIGIGDSQLIEKSPSDVPTDPNKMGMHFEHCPYCFSHANAIGLTSSSIELFIAELNSTEHIVSYTAPIVIAYFASSHPSHAPPAF
ncbi:MAG: DUF2946 domain-containing protein [Methylophilus sp.]|nr:DUF2946 domain-containing protein [Methylophilus sp.]